MGNGDMSYFQIADGIVSLSDGEHQLILEQAQFRQLEPDVVFPPVGVVERWTPDLHYIQDPDQKASPYGDRSMYVARIEQYQNAIAQSEPEPEPEPLPDWDMFYANLEGSEIETRIATTSSNAFALTKLMIEMGKRPAVDAGRVMSYWNAAAPGLSPGQIDVFNGWAIAAHLPVRLDELGKMNSL